MWFCCCEWVNKNMMSQSSTWGAFINLRSHNEAATELSHALSSKLLFLSSLTRMKLGKYVISVVLLTAWSWRVLFSEYLLFYCLAGTEQKAQDQKWHRIILISLALGLSNWVIKFTKLNLNMALQLENVWFESTVRLVFSTISSFNLIFLEGMNGICKSLELLLNISVNTLWIDEVALWLEQYSQ